MHAYIAEPGCLEHLYRPSSTKPITGPDIAVAALAAFGLPEAMREHFMVMLLNARHEEISSSIISVGSLNASIVHPREVFRPAIIAGAATVLLAHNHPSGDPEPSHEDLSITRRLVEAGELLGIGVLDHLIIASRGVVSFRERGIL